MEMYSQEKMQLMKKCYCMMDYITNDHTLFNKGDQTLYLITPNQTLYLITPNLSFHVNGLDGTLKLICDQHLFENHFVTVHEWRDIQINKIIKYESR
jgi:hypothetical protein